MTNILWQPHSGPQYEALTRTEFEIGYGGARGGGKTDAGIAWLSRWTHIKRGKALVIRKNSDDLKDWVDRARYLYQSAGGVVTGKPPVITFPSGFQIVTGHLKDDNAYTKYQGHEYQKMVIEELTQIPTEQNYLMLLASCRSTLPELKPQVFTNFNPGGIGHVWVKERFGITGAPREPIETIDAISGRSRVFIPARIDDNPTLMRADPDYVRFLESLPPDLRRAWRDGDFDIFAGQFFAEWKADKHVVYPFSIPITWKRYRSIDVGGRNGITSCHWFALDYDKNVWVYKEYYATGKDSDEHAKAITDLSKDELYQYTVIDSAAFNKLGLPETIAEVYIRNGVNDLVPSSKDRKAGWDFMHQYLRWNAEREPQIKFFSTCTEAIRTIPTLIHDDKDPEDVDTDGEDHAADEIRYFLQTLRQDKSAKPLSPIELKLKQLKQQDSEDYSYQRK